jgi:ornithine carbamoyltransferase
MINPYIFFQYYNIFTITRYMDLIGRDFITTEDFTTEEIEFLVIKSLELKQAFHRGIPHKSLLDKTLFLLFFDKSTRTRNAFEAAMTQLGGHAHYIDVSSSQIAHGESPKDTGIILSSYGHGIAIRHDLIPGEGNRYQREVAKWAKVPVINLQCDIDHPTQTLADLMTLWEFFGTNLRGLKIAVSWAFAPSYLKPLSVPQGLITLMTRFGMDVVLAHPPEYTLMPETLEQARDHAEKSGGKFRIVDSMEEAFHGADAVYPKSWGILDLFGAPDKAMTIAQKYRHWICDEKAMSWAKSTTKYMHCLPADRGNEVTDAVIDGPNSVVYPEAENRLHTAKALLSTLLA